MAKREFAYAPCEINEKTGKPYSSHDWEIVDNVLLVKKGSDPHGPGITYYHVRCKRCLFNDPNPPTH